MRRARIFIFILQFSCYLRFLMIRKHNKEQEKLVFKHIGIFRHL